MSQFHQGKLWTMSQFHQGILFFLPTSRSHQGKLLISESITSGNTFLLTGRLILSGKTFDHRVSLISEYFWVTLIREFISFDWQVDLIREYIWPVSQSYQGIHLTGESISSGNTFDRWVNLIREYIWLMSQSHQFWDFLSFNTTLFKLYYLGCEVKTLKGRKSVLF